MGKTVDAVRTTLNEAIKRGAIDRDLHAAPISVMLTIAETIDNPEFPIIDNRYDNVSIPTLLKYLQAMGLTVTDVKPQKKEERPEDALDKISKKFHVA